MKLFNQLPVISFISNLLSDKRYRIVRVKIIIILLVIPIVSCASCNQTKVSAKKSLIIGDPVKCGLFNMVIFPVGTSYKPMVYRPSSHFSYKKKRKNMLYFSKKRSNVVDRFDRFAQVEYTNDKQNDFDIRNILFYNLLTRKSHNLSSTKLHILSFAIHKEFKRPLIFYRVVKKDHNMDKKYNSLDPVMLYVSDLNGRNFVQVTPENEQFIDYYYYPTAQTILIKTIVDSNNNKNFEPSDETNFVVMNIRRPALGKQVFSKQMKDSLKSQTKIN